MGFDAVESGAQLTKRSYKALLPDLRVGLLNAQFDLRDADFSVVVVLAGNDRIGATAALRSLHEVMDGRYMKTVALPRRAEHGSQQPLLTRYWDSLPRNGQIGLFYGGWPIEAVYERVMGSANDQEFERTVDHIRQFEDMLTAEGTLLLKFWLHLPKEVFQKRLKRAKSDPDEWWRVNKADWAAYDVYDDAIEVATSLVEDTDPPAAPWVIVECTDKRHRDATISQHILAKVAARIDLSVDSTHQGAVSDPLEPADQPTPSAALAAVDLSASLSKSKYRRKRDRSQRRINRLTSKAVEEGVSSVLAFEGWDAAGKGGAIRRLTSAIAPQNHRVIPVAAPTAEELAHPYLWRFWNRLPEPGRITIFDRSWYGRVLVERVEGLASSSDWGRAYDEINDFEAQLCESGMVVMKFWLHIDSDEQLRRFDARAETPYKKHKLTEEDYRNRKRWMQYEAAVQEMVDRTSTDHAPWHLIPANNKRWARVAVLEEYERRLSDAL